ncbi:MAG: c-type cytochrome domain-containing protein [Planctomycetota bacterium]
MKTLTIVLGILGALVAAALVAMPFVFPLEGKPGPDWVVAAGRFHILALHFPIGLLLIVPVFEMLGLPKFGKALRPVPSVLMGLAICFAVGTCVLGYMLAWGDGDAGELLDDHLWGGIITTVVMIAALVIRLAYTTTKRAGVYVLYLATLGLSLASLTWGSHHGASLVHGEDYLYAKLPVSFQQTLGVYEAPLPPLSEASPVFAGIIEPIFDQHCYSCHSEAKEKGRFRMDEFELLLVGGKSGIPGIAHGDLSGSEVFNRISLPLNDDKVMPPIEKARLSAQETALLRWWIQGGASETVTIKQLSEQSFPEEIETAVMDLLGVEEEVPEPLSPEAFAAVAGQVKSHYSIDLFAYSQNLEDGLFLETQNASTPLSAEVFAELKPVATHLVSINLWRRQLEPGALQRIASFPALSTLQLGQTNITREDLQHLVGLNKLRSLNLHGTAIDDSAVETLSQIKSLRRLFLFDTGISAEGIELLRDALKDCEILVPQPAGPETPVAEGVSPAEGESAEYVV